MTRNQRVPVTEDRLRHIVLNMRERDRAEIYALRWTDDPEEIVQGLLPLCGAMCWIWERDGVPVSIMGAVGVRPGVWDMFAFGTDMWPRVVLDMTRHATRFIIPALLRVGGHRGECRALASHMDSRKWLLSLGFYEEAVLEGYGREGETFVSYAWRPANVHGRWRRRWTNGSAAGDHASASQGAG